MSPLNSNPVVSCPPRNRHDVYETVFYVHYALILPNMMGSTSIKINIAEKRLYKTEHSSRKFMSFLYLQTAMNLFVGWRTIGIFFSKGAHHDFYFHMCYAISFLLFMSNSCMWYAFFKIDEAIDIINQTVAYSCKFERKWMLKSYNPDVLACTPGRFLDAAIILSMCIVLFVPILTAVHYFYLPDLPIFLPTVLPLAEKNERWEFSLKQTNGVKLAFGCFGAWFWLATAQIFHTNLIVLAIYTGEFKRVSKKDTYF
ncbi:hypothetical protein Fcan01_08891 [Folsomia candida]|uniref:Uncharacterized protein n=1 Tax=Folsomia candida TaxID=158441 RepID=A0A226EE86_FOLCA|nr:hypothetical protein Fcan01_08891 [Folsomia candida]